MSSNSFLFFGKFYIPGRGRKQNKRGESFLFSSYNPSLSSLHAGKRLRSSETDENKDVWRRELGITTPLLRKRSVGASLFDYDAVFSHRKSAGRGESWRLPHPPPVSLNTPTSSVPGRTCSEWRTLMRFVVLPRGLGAGGWSLLGRGPLQRDSNWVTSAGGLKVQPCTPAAGSVTGAYLRGCPQALLKSPAT